MKHFFGTYKKAMLLPGIVITCFFLYFFLQPDDDDYSTASLIETISQSESNESEVQQPEIQLAMTVFVDVKGAVNYPGVFELTDEHRIIDAIELAGGYTAEADPNLINHAQKLVDEMVIYVPQVGEEVPELLELAVAGSATKSGESNSGKVNLNKASEAELATLPGIGPSKAQAIIAYRDETGKFQTIDDLKKVTGIGEKTYDRLKDLIEI